MASMAALSSVNTQAKSVFHCAEQESCNDLDGCGGACECTCDSWTSWPNNCAWDPGGPYWYNGYCLIPYSAEE